MISSLARFFRGLNMAMGVTTLPENAPLEQQRKFVMVWLGIIVFCLVWVGVLFFWIVS